MLTRSMPIQANSCRTTRASSLEEIGAVRVITDPGAAAPEVNLLSNGRYHVVITGAGGGYSRWRDLAVTRWREDPTSDCWGSLCFLRDLDSGDFWSTSWQPTSKPARRFQAIFTQGRAEFRRADPARPRGSAESRACENA